VHVTRPATVIAGAAALAVAWLAPLRDLCGGGFAAHMTAHMLLVAIASPLLAYGLAGGRLDPLRMMPWLGAAIPASLFELAVVSTWHAPTLHHAARQRTDVFVAEQASFLAAGLWLWFAVLGGDPEARARRAGSSVVALLLTFAHMTLLGALLALTPRPLYAHTDAASTRPALAHPGLVHQGLAESALADQQLGGAIMLLLGGCAYIGGGLGIARTLLRRPRALAVPR
jgi:putative membrane protein